MRTRRARSLPAQLHAFICLCRRAPRHGQLCRAASPALRRARQRRLQGAQAAQRRAGGPSRAEHGNAEGDLAVGRVGYPELSRKQPRAGGGTSTMRAVLVRSSMAPTLVTTSSAVTATKYATPSAMICAPRPCRFQHAWGMGTLEGARRMKTMSLRCRVTCAGQNVITASMTCRRGARAHDFGSSQHDAQSPEKGSQLVRPHLVPGGHWM